MISRSKPGASRTSMTQATGSSEREPRSVSSAVLDTDRSGASCRLVFRGLSKHSTRLNGRPPLARGDAAVGGAAGRCAGLVPEGDSARPQVGVWGLLVSEIAAASRARSRTPAPRPAQHARSRRSRRCVRGDVGSQRIFRRARIADSRIPCASGNRVAATSRALANRPERKPSVGVVAGILVRRLRGDS